MLAMGIFNVESMLYPMSTLPRPPVHFLIGIFLITGLSTAVTIVGICLEGYDVCSVMCWPSASWTSIYLRMVTSVFFIIAAVLNSITVTVQTCRRLKSNRLTQFQRCIKAQALIRFAVGLACISTLLVTGWALSGGYSRAALGEGWDERDGPNINAADYGLSLFGSLLLFSWNRGLLSFVSWLCIPWGDQEKPRLHILPKYLDRFYETRPNRRESNPAQVNKQRDSKKEAEVKLMMSPDNKSPPPMVNTSLKLTKDTFNRPILEQRNDPKFSNEAKVDKTAVRTSEGDVGMTV